MSFDELKVAGDDFGGLLLFEHTTAEDHSLTDRRPTHVRRTSLAEWYSSNQKAKGLEVVFASSDRDDSGFQE